MWLASLIVNIFRNELLNLYWNFSENLDKGNYIKSNTGFILKIEGSVQLRWKKGTFSLWKTIKGHFLFKTTPIVY